MEGRAGRHGVKGTQEAVRELGPALAQCLAWAGTEGSSQDGLFVFMKRLFRPRVTAWSMAGQADKDLP